MTRSLSVVHRKEAGLVVGADVYQQMNQMVTGHWVAQVVRAAVDLSLAEHLAVDGLTGDEVAEREGSAPATTSRLMRACVALGVLSADDHGRYFGTGLLATLHRDAPGSMRGLALATTLPAQWLSWNEFTTSVRTGRTQAAAALGSDFFEYLAEHRQQARDISAGMTTTTSLWTSDAAKVIDTDGVGLAVDVGGANGSLLHLLLDANPTLRGIVLDRPNIVEEAAAETAKRGLRIGASRRPVSAENDAARLGRPALHHHPRQLPQSHCTAPRSPLPTRPKASSRRCPCSCSTVNGVRRRLSGARVGQRIGSLVAGITGMSSYPPPLDVVRCRGGGQGAPEVGVLDRLPVRGHPAVSFPALDPGGHAVQDVLAVGIQHHVACSRERGQRFDGSSQFHSLVRGRGCAAGQLALVRAAG
jgi:O-methyltransferase domain/Dimerisation domain